MSKRSAVIQMLSSADVADNLARAGRLLQQAADKGACLAILPENFAALGHPDIRALAQSEANGTGPVQDWLAATASRLGLWIVAGSLPLFVPGCRQGKPAAACLLYNAEGQQVARYDKLHLFDASVADRQGRYRESDNYAAGNRVVVADTPLGRLGLAICYDIRFPGLFTAMREQGAELLAIPAAFTAVTGAAHWHALLRARAIENQCFVLAADQGGRHSAQRETFGHSMIIDPWGEILAEHDQGEHCLLAELKLDALQQLRSSMPVWEHRRLTVPGLMTRKTTHE